MSNKLDLKVGDKAKFRRKKCDDFGNRIFDCKILKVYEKSRLFQIEYIDSGGSPLKKIIRFSQIMTDDDLEEASKERALSSKDNKCEQRCNLCGRKFKARNRFMRFCDVCKGRSEIYRFAESI